MFGASNGTASTGGGLFGSSNTNSNTGGLFGAKPATSTGFGATSNTSGGLFGQQQQQQQQQPQQQQQSGGLFGAKPAGAATGGGLFGQPNTTTSTGFGNTGGTTGSSGGGLFGQSNTAAGGPTSTSGGLFGGTSTGNTGTASGGLFGGSNAANTATGGTTTGGLFGGSNAGATNTSGGLFGGNTASNTTGGGLFGSKPATTGATGGGLFGGANTSTTSGGLFGNKPATTTTGGGLFGGAQQAQQPQQPQQPQQSSGLFSNNTTNNAQPSFSWSQPPKANTSAFQNNNNAANQQPAQNTTNINTYTPAVNDQLNKIWDQWDPNSGKNALKSSLYNKFTDDEMKILLNQPRPNNITSEEWENAMNKRPGPNYYPIPVNSFNEIATRIETQLDHVSKSRVLLNNINTNLDNLSSQHDLENTTRILKAKLNHEKLSRRLLRLATVLSIIKLKGYPLLPEEEEISKQFDLLSNKLNDPNGSIGKLNDLFARLSILKERAEDLNLQFDNSINLLNNEELGEKSANGTTTTNANNANNSDEVVNKISQILLKQQMGLNYLNDILEKDKSKLK
ncbi:Nucleoporin NUP57 [Candida viswanathii]|uniref:Nucleoporin NUP57 n=1 Tax=Candida viswanathii TaxID=5486 RepID=A0A367YBB4_9ASCO|nr:Nucleoporin NUP57 [Candida viswanathii]